MERKKLINQLPVWLRVSIYFIVIVIAAYLGGVIPALDSIFFYFGIALLLSFLFLKAEGEPLTSLGFVPTCAADWKNFFRGLLIGLLALLTSAGLTVWFNGSRLVFTGHADPVFLLILIFIHLWSSFAQEFTYRGLSFSTFIDLVWAMGSSTGDNSSICCHAPETEYRHHLAAVFHDLAYHRHGIDTLWALLSQDRQIDIVHWLAFWLELGPGACSPFAGGK